MLGIFFPSYATHRLHLMLKFRASKDCVSVRRMKIRFSFYALALESNKILRWPLPCICLCTLQAALFSKYKNIIGYYDLAFGLLVKL